MGRSQVKYNRTHGRPGTKGRGGGRGRGAESSSRQQQQPQGDNAWRYENLAPTEHTSGMNLEMLNLETQKLPQYSENAVEDFGGLHDMGKALDQLSVAERLGIPAYLTVDLEVGENKNKMKDEKVPSLDTRKTNNKSADAASKQTRDENEARTGDPPSNKTTNKNDSSGDEEDDLDAWLDTVIT